MNAITHPRPTCYRCFRPLGVCYCEDLRPVNNRTHIVILQHPREQFHPLNTVRIAEHSLQKVSVVCSGVKTASDKLERIFDVPGAAVLFPSDDAEDLAALHPDERPSLVVVLDGTWHHARTLLRDVPFLSRLRRVRFHPPRPSEYRIRREPRADYLSTIESIAHVLHLLEPDTPDIEALSNAFRRMIDKNVAARDVDLMGRRGRTKQRAIGHRFPTQLRGERTSLAAVYCEGASLSDDACRTELSRRRHPLVVYVEGRAGQPRQRFVVRLPFAPRARLLAHLNLSLDDLQAEGHSPAQAVEGILHALGDRVPVVWNPSGRQILKELGLPAVPLVLKGVYCDWMLYQARRPGRLRGVRQEVGREASADLLGAAMQGGQALGGRPLGGQVQSAGEGWGSVGAAARRHGLPEGTSSVLGRGERRIVQTEAILSWICDEARAHGGDRNLLPRAEY